MKHNAAPTPRAIGSARVGAAAITLALLWLILGTYVIHAKMPTTAFTLPAESRVRPLLILLVPEGWAFFTKSPRDNRLLAFIRSADGAWTYANRGPNSEPRNSFGMSRSSRAQGPEISLLIALLPSNAWQDCVGDPRPCLETVPVGIAGPSPSPIPTLCGTVGVALQKPLPWAWYQARAEVRLPSRVAKLEVTC